MEIQGQLIKIFKPVTGEGRNGQWKRQDLLIEIQGQFPKKICFSVNSDKTPINSFKVGDFVTVSINVESREHNGRWFTDIRAWKIDISGAAGQASPTEIQGTIIQTLPPMSGTSKTGKTWKRQDYVLETQDQFPRKVCFSVWGDRINPSTLQNGTVVTVTVDIESREGSNGGWFTSVQAWKSIQGAATSTNIPTNSGYGIESQKSDVTAISADQIKSQSDGEDLPF